MTSRFVLRFRSRVGFGLAAVLFALAAWGVPVAEPPRDHLVVLDLSLSHWPHAEAGPRSSQGEAATAAALASLRARVEETLGPNDRLRLVGAGTRPVLLSAWESSEHWREEATWEALEARLQGLDRSVRRASDAASALRLGSQPSGESRGRRHLILISDGRWTLPEWRALRGQLGESDASFQLWDLGLPAARDLRLELVRGPDPGTSGGYLYTLRVACAGPGERAVTVAVGGQLYAASVREGHPALLRCELASQDFAGAPVRAALAALDGPDADPRNNRIALPPPARERPPVWVLGERSEELVGRLRAAGFEAHAGFPKAGSAGALAHAVLLAGEVPLEAETGATQAEARLWEAPRAALSSGGLALVLYGGSQSFGAGGWAARTFESLSPLSSRLEPRRDVHVLLDTSGSMADERRGAPRLRRAATAIAQLARGLGEEGRLQVHPFAERVGAPVPRVPVSGARWRLDGAPKLAEIRASGGTRALPALRSLMERLRSAPVEPGRTRGLLLLSDLDDEELLAARAPSGLAQLELRPSVALWLDPKPERAAALRSALAPASIALQSVQAIVPRLLLEAGGSEAERQSPTALLGAEGRRLGSLPAFNPTRGIPSARIEVATEAGAPVLAQRPWGAGRVWALATDPLRSELGFTLLLGALEQARKAVAAPLSVRREEEGLIVRLGAGREPPAALEGEEGSGRRFALRERAPREWVGPVTAPGPITLRVPGEADAFYSGVPEAAFDPEWSASRRSLPTPSRARSEGPGGRIRRPFALLGLMVLVGTALWGKGAPARSFD